MLAAKSIDSKSEVHSAQTISIAIVVCAYQKPAAIYQQPLFVEGEMRPKEHVAA